MRERRALFGTIFFLAATVTAATAAAQTTPKFEFDKPPEKPTDWKVQAKGGLLITSGNSQSRNASLGVTGSRQTGDNKLSLDANLAYGRSNVIVPVIVMNEVTA